MRRLLLALLTVAFAGSAAAAQAVDPAPSRDDPLQSADCRQALEALRMQEVAAAAAAASELSDGYRQRVPDTKLEAARRQAAIACLASRADPPPPPQPQPRRLAQPPIAVPPVADGRSTTRPGSPIEPLRPLPRPADKPTFIMSCDAVGCWANDGSRLNRVGPNLWGSRGACSVQGTLLQCP